MRALTFYAPPTKDDLRPDLTLPVAARMIAGACGYAGSNTEYLFQTVKSLEEHGIWDEDLWHLQELVANEIEALSQAPT